MAAAVLLVLLPILVATTAPAASAASGGGEKSTHIKLYWHDVLSGPNATAVWVNAAETNTSKTFFGAIAVIDDPLTEGPDLNSSKLLGRAQGMYVGTGIDELSLLMNMNFLFQAGKYNGSSVTIMGHNAVFNHVREMPIVGGTGVFRMARGYAELRTYVFDPEISLNAIVEYNLYIEH